MALTTISPGLNLVAWTGPATTLSAAPWFTAANLKGIFKPSANRLGLVSCKPGASFPAFTQLLPATDGVPLCYLFSVKTAFQLEDSLLGIVATLPGPAISSFFPLTGTAGSDVTLTGVHLGATSAVYLNGDAATFTINTDTSIQVRVPEGALSGVFHLQTPAGTAVTPNRFTIVNETVGAAPSVSLKAPATAIIGSPTTLNSTPTDADGVITQVDWYEGDIKFATSTSAPWSTEWTPTGSFGYRTLYVRATDNAGNITQSLPVGVTVAPPTSIPGPVFPAGLAWQASFTADFGQTNQITGNGDLYQDIPANLPVLMDNALGARKAWLFNGGEQAFQLDVVAPNIDYNNGLFACYLHATTEATEQELLLRLALNGEPSQGPFWSIYGNAVFASQGMSGLAADVPGRSLPVVIWNEGATRKMIVGNTLHTATSADGNFLGIGGAAALVDMTILKGFAGRLGGFYYASGPITSLQALQVHNALVAYYGEIPPPYGIINAAAIAEDVQLVGTGWTTDGNGVSTTQAVGYENRARFNFTKGARLDLRFGVGINYEVRLNGVVILSTTDYPSRLYYEISDLEGTNYLEVYRLNGGPELIIDPAYSYKFI